MDTDRNDTASAPEHSGDSGPQPGVSQTSGMSAAPGAQTASRANPDTSSRATPVGESLWTTWKSMAPGTGALWYPVPPRGAFAALGLVIAGDLLIYRGSGGFGYGLFVPIACLLMLWGIGAAPGRLLCLPGLMAALFAVRTAWQAEWYSATAGFFILSALGMRLWGYAPSAPGGIIACFMSMLASPIRAAEFGWTLLGTVRLERLARINALQIVVPVGAGALFFLVFRAANPVLAAWTADGWAWVSNAFSRIENWLPTGTDLVFWCFMALCAATWLCPLRVVGDDPEADAHKPRTAAGPATEGGWAMARNTLMVLIALFAAYLMIDIRYLWIERCLPAGFSYSQYAIDGTIWLTMALALTSLTLGIIFAGQLCFHPRAQYLRAFSTIWVAQNLLIAVFAYQRLAMYVTFNGLTYWRIVGAFGIATVIMGLVFVWLKINRYHSLYWLVRRQMAAFLIMLFALVVFPSDLVSGMVNTRLILKGEMGPAYQVACQPVSAEGLVPLVPLLDADDPVIRAGVASLLRLRLADLRAAAERRPRWTCGEWAHVWALATLTASEARIRDLSPGTEDRAWRVEWFRFDDDAGARPASPELDELKRATAAYSWPGRPAE